jgi:hypothetical protein
MLLELCTEQSLLDRYVHALEQPENGRLWRI